MGRLILAACVALGAHVLLLLTNTPWVLPKITPPKWGARPVVMTLEAVRAPTPVQSVKTDRKEINKSANRRKISTHKAVVKRTGGKKTPHPRRPKRRIKLARKKHVQPLMRAERKIVKKQESHPVQKQTLVSRQPEEPAQSILEPKASRMVTEQVLKQSRTWTGISDDILAEVPDSHLASLSTGASEQNLIVEARPAYLKNPPPPYPAIARRRGYQGTVILEVLVSKDGAVKDLRVFKSSGHKELDKTAMRAVKKWIFEPGKKGSTPIDMWVKVPIRFVLK
ncbi:MAG: hypothetical protein DRH12_10910 [Deltaproteobacteria bacterium]|nr:MAG: hypothetical protein DRH12_10910 [Deltaproteobacteria bacterium]